MGKNKSHSNGLQEQRDQRGRFIMGVNGGPGRPKGSRNRLGEQFIADLHEQWLKHGKDVLDRVVRDEPAKFLKTVAALMPKEIDATLTTVDVELFAECRSFVEAFKLARQVIGAEVDGDDEVALIEQFKAEE